MFLSVEGELIIVYLLLVDVEAVVDDVIGLVEELLILVV